MRVIQISQMQVGEVDISKIKLDSKSRDDIPQLLAGLQHIYTDPTIRDEIFKLLAGHIAPKIDKNNGRPGMALWKIFVMGVLRLNLNWDYDRLTEQVNQHFTIRLMLGNSEFDKTPYQLQTIKDNVRLMTPQLLDKINQVIVKSGHGLLKKKGNEALRGRCDSFVVETNVHYPTDINLLYDAMRKAITLTAAQFDKHHLVGWREHGYNVRHVKRLMRNAQNQKRSKAKSEAQKARQAAGIRKAHLEYLDVSKRYLTRVEESLKTLEKLGLQGAGEVTVIMGVQVFIEHAKRQMNQIERRVFAGEAIPHDEKVFSIFQPHTEWISKGKAGVPVELGVRVGIVEDQYQFILHHQVMEAKTDDQSAVPIVKETIKRFPEFILCSFDKGAHSPENQKTLSNLLDMVVLPRKGKLTAAERQVEESEEFRIVRRKHSAVESAINALEVHGLDICPDNGIWGFKRYVALAVVARNIQRIGAILISREREKEARKNRAMNADHRRAA